MNLDQERAEPKRYGVHEEEDGLCERISGRLNVRLS
jgi:hypothetical protein